MNKRYIFLTIIAFASMMRAEDNTEIVDVTRSGSVIAATLYKPVTATSIKNGLVIDKPGSYVFAVPTTIPSTGSFQNTATIAAAPTTNGTIIITTNDVTLNLNGYSLKTDLSGRVAIYVNDNVSGVIIENGSILSGSANWSSGIVVGLGCSDITIRDMNIHSCDKFGATTYSAIDIIGTSTSAATHCKGVTLDNVKVFGYTGDNAGSINCTYVDSLDFINVRANNASVSGAHDSMLFTSCNNVRLTNVKADNNAATGAQTGLRFATCNGIVIDGASASGNTGSSASSFDAFKFATCNNIQVSNADANNNTRTGVSGNVNGFYLPTCLNVKLNNITTANNTAESLVYGLNLSACKNVEATNVEVNSNQGKDGTAGLLLTTCKDMNFVNVLCANSSDSTNTTATGVTINGCSNINFNHFEANNLTKAKAGIDFITIASTNISFANSSISNCSSTAAAFIGVNGEVKIESLKLVNCSISNNTGITTFDGVKLTAGTSKNVLLDGVHILNNTASAGNLNGFNLANTNGVVVNNCKVEHNTCTETATAYTFNGLYAAETVTNLTISNSSFSSNNASYTPVGPDGSVTAYAAGVYVVGASTLNNGLSIDNCQANSNFGAAQAYGFYVSLTNNASITNCTANGNYADMNTTGGSLTTHGTAVLPTAGFYLWKCNYCTVDNCFAINNQAGNRAPGTVDNVIDLTSSCSGFGFMNIGDSNTTKSIGNNYKNCVANGNTTQHSSVAATVSGIAGYAATGVTSTANYGKRYYQDDALAGGFGAQWSQGTEFYNCTANNNGNNPFVISYGFLVVNNSTSNQCKQINITKCTANNNQYFGFVDSGVHQTTQVNSETTLFANYAAMNGEHNLMLVDASGTEFNPVGTVAAGVMDGHFRNYWLYFSDAGQDIPIKKVSYGGQGMAQIPGNELFNISMAKDA